MFITHIDRVEPSPDGNTMHVSLRNDAGAHQYLSMSVREAAALVQGIQAQYVRAGGRRARAVAAAGGPALAPEFAGID